eukprot:TRINITY_DN82832_c0_g1_i1.p1 TRINITY_DN82832_c0_g1~~TRINITY_DN82832_c0_g1_i1.p1  ORF type:complete len:472 (+),score=94.64 TRINITY_DN82832_c0_g1_i1:95-1510(+)
MNSKESCLFLAEWEAARCEVHTVRRKHAESQLCNLQLRSQNALAALNSWLAVLETRRKLNEAAATAASTALQELEARWKPVRLDACDGAAASWLLASERAHVASLTADAKLWAQSAPEGGNALRNQHQVLAEHLQSEVVGAIRSWDQAHQDTSEAWLSHNQRLDDTAKAVAEERAPPDSWLSEVRYREFARKHSTEQARTEELISKALSTLNELEAERNRFWEAYAQTYQGSCAQLKVAPSVGETAPQLDTSAVQLANGVALPEEPEMPSAGGAVLQRVQAAMQAPSGLFGLGGGGWREGATLVLTLHGYLHLFFPDPPPKGQEKVADGGAGESPQAQVQGAMKETELVESAIKASVYVPMATKCVFQRKGKDLMLDLVEQETEAPQVAKEPSGGAAAAAASVRKWFSGRPGTDEPVPRRVHAKLTDAAEFQQLEGRCHEFVRRGHSLRASASGGSRPAGSPVAASGEPRI